MSENGYIRLSKAFQKILGLLLCYVMLCYVMSCYVMLQRYVIFILCYVMLGEALSARQAGEKKSLVIVNKDIVKNL